MDKVNRYKALEAVKNSDGRPMIAEEIKKRSAEFMKQFIGDIDQTAYEPKWNDLHLVQAQIKTLDWMEGIVDDMMRNEQPMMILDNPTSNPTE